MACFNTLIKSIFFEWILNQIPPPPKKKEYVLDFYDFLAYFPVENSK